MTADSDHLIHGKFLLCPEKLGAGAFGLVNRGVNRETGEEVAVKMESRNEKIPLLWKEFLILKAVHRDGAKKGFPIPLSHGHFLNYDAMVMTCLGPSLEDLMKNRTASFSAKSALCVGVQLVRLVQTLHSRGFVHGDLKPANILTGREGDRESLHVVDFGAALAISRAGTKQFETNSLRGFTPVFMSNNTHRYCRLSQRDDLQSIGYIVVDLFQGRLPWSTYSYKEHGPDYVNLILRSKECLKLEDLCKGLPNEVQEFIAYARNLAFAVVPNYIFCSDLLLRALMKLRVGDRAKLDWSGGEPHQS